MNLQTKIPLEKLSTNLIDYNSNILLLGSCFVENIGEKLSYFKFKNLQNPFGILFHPKAIQSLISNAINQKVYTDKDIFFYNEQWHCFDAHSKISASSQENLLNDLNIQLELTNQQIQNSTHIIITLGTAWVYRLLETNDMVANCHKVPQKQFKKELMSVDEVSDALQSIVDLIKSVNSDALIIFTLSPIRHIKDGFIENTQSKAHLITAIHQVVSFQLSINYRQLAYFPSYEIMMDELRDYRFYAEDLIHPSKTAIQYIWEKFQAVWVSNETLKTMKDVEIVQKSISHKPFNSNSEGHQNFLLKLEKQKVLLKAKFQHISF